MFPVLFILPAGDDAAACAAAAAAVDVVAVVAAGVMPVSFAVFALPLLLATEDTDVEAERRDDIEDDDFVRCPADGLVLLPGAVPVLLLLLLADVGILLGTIATGC